MSLDWRPFFLRPDTPPQGLQLSEPIRARHRDPDDPLKARARALGLTMKFRDVVPSTRRAHETAEYARAHGKLAPMHASLLRRYWSDGEDLWQLEVLRAAASEVGLDPADLSRALEAGTFKAAVEASIDEARQLGIHAVPTFVFDDRMALQGAHELATFRRVMEQLGAHRAATAQPL